MRITLYNIYCRVVTEERDRKWRLEWNPRGSGIIPLIFTTEISQKSKVHNPTICDIYSQAGLNRANRGKEGVVAKKKAWNHRYSKIEVTWSSLGERVLWNLPKSVRRGVFG